MQALNLVYLLTGIKIIEIYSKHVYWVKKPKSSITLGVCPSRLCDRHFSEKTESAEGNATKKVQRRCTY
ncbi:hypothetical protein E2C01_044138 [Portunus trituberculatus]|uniref:Uncharacterized protein n=1 Tax=Portunus trituberculatus TaxID=210409 RepID=A0A5B7FZ55_PORTR|nr:hypothetical protein [Portunus trituberculatus]